MSNLRINENAPAIGSAEIEINTIVENVWNILTDFENWSKWNKSVTKMKVNGEVKVGTIFEWTANNSKIISKIEEINAPNKIVWTGKTFGIKALHIWEFKYLDGKTSVFTQESFEGIIAKLLKGMLSKMLHRTLQQNLRDLKQIAESK